MKQKILFLIIINILSIYSLFSLEKKVSVAIFNGANPILFTDDYGNATGFFPSVLNDLLPDYDITYITNISFDEAMAKVKSGEIDIIPAFLKSDERLQDFYFNDSPVMVSWGELFVSHNNIVESIFDLKDKKIAIMNSDQNGINFIKMMKDFNISFEVIYYDDYISMKKSVLSDEVYGMIGFNTHRITSTELVPTTIIFSPSQAFFATSKSGNIDAIKEISKRLKIQQKDLNSKYYANQKKWLMNNEVIHYPKWLKYTLRAITLTILIFIFIFVYQRFKLKSITNKYIDFITNSIDLIWITNKNNNISYINNHAENFFLIKNNSCINKDIYCLFKDCDVKKIEKIVLDCSNGILYDGELTLNDNRTVLLSITKVLRGKDKGGFFFNAKDITENKLVEKQLFQSQKNDMIANLTSTIAHDFNNLLSPIIGMTELLLINDNFEKHKKEYLPYILKAATDSSELVKKLQLYSKKSNLNISETTIFEIITEFKSILQQSLPTGISLSINLSDIQYKVLVDKVEINQVLLSLVINARDAIGDEGEIIINNYNISDIFTHISKECNPIEGQYTVIEIIDNGCGISEEIQKHIFELYYATKGAKGSGLGLASCYGIITQLKGYISVKSIEGEGTTFKIFLPTK